MEGQCRKLGVADNMRVTLLVWTVDAVSSEIWRSQPCESAMCPIPTTTKLDKVRNIHYNVSIKESIVSLLSFICLMIYGKLDGVGPVDNRPSSD